MNGCTSTEDTSHLTKQLVQVAPGEPIDSFNNEVDGMWVWGLPGTIPGFGTSEKNRVSLFYF